MDSESLIIIGRYRGHLSIYEFCENDHFLGEGKEMQIFTTVIAEMRIFDYPIVNTESIPHVPSTTKIEYLGYDRYCMHNACWNRRACICK